MWSILCGEGGGDELRMGLGGVMLEGTDWQGGLRDRPMISHGGRRTVVDQTIEETVAAIRRTVFPLHGL
jgi:hypothetical protein